MWQTVRLLHNSIHENNLQRNWMTWKIIWRHPKMFAIHLGNVRKSSIHLRESSVSFGNLQKFSGHLRHSTVFFGSLLDNFGNFRNTSDDLPKSLGFSVFLRTKCTLSCFLKEIITAYPSSGRPSRVVRQRLVGCCDVKGKHSPSLCI